MKNSSNHWNQIGKNYAVEWDQNGRQYVSGRELQFLKTSIAEYTAKKGHLLKALDLGSGAGRILHALERSEVIGDISSVDFSEKMLTYCKKRFKNSKKIKRFIRSDIAKKLPFENDTFDIVTTIRAIKYSENWQNIVKECRRVLKKNGILIFEMPNVNSVNRLSQDEIYIHKTTFQKLKQVLKDNDFEILKIKGGPIFPGVVYDRIKGSLLNLAVFNEKLFKMIFGEIFLSRFIYIACRKT